VIDKQPVVFLTLELRGKAEDVARFLRSYSNPAGICAVMPEAIVLDGSPRRPTAYRLGEVCDGDDKRAQAGVAEVKKRLQDTALARIRGQIDQFREITRSARQARGDEVPFEWRCFRT
jgi:hypothetical protein